MSRIMLVLAAAVLAGGCAAKPEPQVPTVKKFPTDSVGIFFVRGQDGLAAPWALLLVGCEENEVAVVCHRADDFYDEVGKRLAAAQPRRLVIHATPFPGEGVLLRLEAVARKVSPDIKITRVE